MQKRTAGNGENGQTFLRKGAPKRNASSLCREMIKLHASRSRRLFTSVLSVNSCLTSSAYASRLFFFC